MPVHRQRHTVDYRAEGEQPLLGRLEQQVQQPGQAHPHISTPTRLTGRRRHATNPAPTNAHPMIRVHTTGTTGETQWLAASTDAAMPTPSTITATRNWSLRTAPVSQTPIPNAANI
jgi:hypothetical protein